MKTEVTIVQGLAVIDSDEKTKLSTASGKKPCKKKTMIIAMIIQYVRRIRKIPLRRLIEISQINL